MRSGPKAGLPLVEIVVPVKNEAHVLADRVTELHRELSAHFPVLWRITIVDNASTDGTWYVALPPVGRAPSRPGDAARAPGPWRRRCGAAWMLSDADVVAYMDVDLSTGLTALFPLVAPLLTGHAGIAVGSRLTPGASVTRGAKRELISRCYNWILHMALGTRVRDAQCGFKAVRTDVARALVPDVEDDGWFFDTELLIRAERQGVRIVEIPVDWVDDPDSRVAIMRTAVDDLRGVRRSVRQLGPRARRVAASRTAAGMLVVPANDTKGPAAA